MPTRDVVFPAGPRTRYERNRYSPAVRSGGVLFVSGQVGSRADGSPEPDMKAQVRIAFDNLDAILSAAGCTFGDVVDATVFVVDPERTFETIWKVVPEYWGDAPHPTLTAVGVTWLSGFEFEIKVIAKIPPAIRPGHVRSSEGYAVRRGAIRPGSGGPRECRHDQRRRPRDRSATTTRWPSSRARARASARRPRSGWRPRGRPSP